MFEMQDSKMAGVPENVEFLRKKLRASSENPKDLLYKLILR